MRGGDGKRGMVGIAWGSWGNVCKGLLRRAMSKVVGFTLVISLLAKHTKALCE